MGAAASCDWLWRNGVAFPKTACAMIHQPVSGAGVEEALAVYWDLDTHLHVHPYIERIQVLSSDPQHHEFIVHDRVPLNFLGLSIPIRVHGSMTLLPGKCATRAEVKAIGRASGTYVEHTLIITEQTGGCLLEEKCSFTAPWPLISFTVKQGMAAHHRVMQGIADILVQQQQQQQQQPS